MENLSLARPYAKAVFALAVEQGTLGQWQQNLQTLVAMVGQSKVTACLQQPQLTKDDKAQILIKLGGKIFDQLNGNFIHILARNNRLFLLPQINHLFKQLKHQQQNSLDIQLTTAYPLATKQSAQLSSQLQQACGKDQVNLDCSTDKSLLGGVVIKIDDLVIDNSMRARIEQLRKTANF